MRGGDIVPGQEAFPLPQPAVHHQLAQLGKVLRLDIQAPRTVPRRASRRRERTGRACGDGAEPLRLLPGAGGYGRQGPVLLEVSQWKSVMPMGVNSRSRRNPERLFPVTLRTIAHAKTPEEIGDFDYGYQIWVGRREDTFLFNGMLGQNPGGPGAEAPLGPRGLPGRRRSGSRRTGPCRP